VVSKLKLDFIKDDYTFITDDTSKLDTKTLFLKTAQNMPYYEKLEVKPRVLLQMN
jgi:UDP-N-acetylmuramoyl-L-alanyl-D-glutamate--2,6-diaminopimelate ligase